MTDARYRDATAFALLLAASLTLGTLATRIAYDDAWITYRYAHNLATGNGLVYNAGERFLGTTAPGYAVLLGVLGWIAPDAIPGISGALCLAALVALGLGLYAFGRAHDDWLGGLTAGLLLTVNPVTLEAFGGEMLPQAALVVWAFAAEARRRWLLAVLLAVAATLLRPDGLLVLAIIGAHQTWKRRALPWREILVAGAILAVWHGALWLYYGWPLPQTLGAKNAQRVSGIWRPLGMDLVEWFKARTSAGSAHFGARYTPGFDVVLGLAALGVPALLWFRHWWLLLVWPVVYMLFYRQLHLPFYHWYAVAPLLAIVVSASAACAAMAAGLGWGIARRAPAADLPGRPGARRLAATIAVLVPVLGLAGLTGRHSAAVALTFPNESERAYAAAGRWLAAHTPPGASIGYLEIGIIGYRAQRPIIDPLGLVNPLVAPHVAQRDFLWAYRHYQPDYIIDNPVFFPELLGKVVHEPWFTASYERVTELDSGRERPMTLFRRTVPRETVR